jgi:5-methylcytosine-specific restriction enzyme subunit McrC
MRQLRLQERDEVTIGASATLSDADVSALCRLEPILPAGCLSWRPRAVRFGPFCGVLRAGDLTIELLPKTGDSLDGEKGVLVAMLRTVGGLVTHVTGEASLNQQRIHLLDQFIFDFCTRVTSMLREGAIARYQQFEDNLTTVRGRLAFTEHFRRNAVTHTHLFCQHDERTVDNPHNRALKAVLHGLRLSAVSTHARGVVDTLLHRFADVSSTTVRPTDFDQLHFDRTTTRWRPTFERAKWLLEGLFPDVRAGAIDGTCLLFNMERLFEAFLGVMVRKAWRDHRNNLNVVLQGPKRDLAASSQGPAFELRPDISIIERDRVVRILDAKWKALDATSANLGVDRADVYQLSAYAGRYGCENIGLVYPVAPSVPAGVRVFRLQIPGNPLLSVHIINVRELALTGALPAELRPQPGSLSMAMLMAHSWPVAPNQGHLPPTTPT